MAIESTRPESDQTNESTVSQLNSFLRGELSAVETYRQSLEKITDANLRVSLEECLRSHETRVAHLRNRISQFGGQPATGSGAWGGFAKLVEGGAKVFGVKAALAALEEGEDHGKKLYRDDLERLDVATRSWVENELQPEQRRTHDLMSQLKHAFH